MSYKSEVEHKFREVLSNTCNYIGIYDKGNRYCQFKYSKRCKDHHGEVLNHDCPKDCPMIQDDISCSLDCNFLNKAWKEFNPILKY